MDIKRIIKRGTKRIVQSGVNTLGYEISWRRQPPSLRRQFLEARPKLPVLSREQPVLSKEQIDAFANKAIDPDYWRRLNPEMSIDGVGERSSGLDIEALEPKEIEKQVEKLRSEGYFQTNPVLLSRTTDKMRLCVERLRRERWPEPFPFVYDEFWDIASIPSLTEILTELLGAKYRQTSNFWTYYRKGAGSRPHADYPDLPAPRRGRLTVWIPLSDATVDNSCIYLIPQDRVSSVKDLFTYNYVTHRELSDLLWVTKALPAPAGSVLGWCHDTIHWGSFASDGAHPRVSLRVEFIGSGEEPQPLDFDVPCRCTFSQRIQMICNIILSSSYPGTVIYRGLAERLKEMITP
jgi:hypothetical protein